MNREAWNKGFAAGDAENRNGSKSRYLLLQSLSQSMTSGSFVAEYLEEYTRGYLAGWEATNKIEQMVMDRKALEAFLLDEAFPDKGETAT